jgi:hypothetical protein
MFKKYYKSRNLLVLMNVNNLLTGVNSKDNFKKAIETFV